MSDDVKLLKDLKAEELRAALNIRDLSPIGLKPVLVDRLKNYLEENGLDPKTYDFNEEMVTTETSLNMNISAFLASLGLEQLQEVFDREQITVDILSEMGHEDLKQIGVTAYGHRHKLINGFGKKKQANKMIAKPKDTPQSGSPVIDMLNPQPGCSSSSGGTVSQILKKICHFKI